MMLPGDCSECCLQLVCTHEQLFFIDGTFKLVSAKCRATNGIQFCHKCEPLPLEPVEPRDWYQWATIGRESVIDSTKPFIAPRPVWDYIDEPVKPNVVKPARNMIDKTMKTEQPVLKKVCKSTTEASVDWWDKMKNKSGKD